jgi:hypothetical protein
LELVVMLRCTAEVGKGWMMEMHETGIEKGLHPSAMELDATGQLQEETLEEVAQGGHSLRVVTWLVGIEA